MSETISAGCGDGVKGKRGAMGGVVRSPAGRRRDGVVRPAVLCVRTTYRTQAWFQLLTRRHGGAGRALEALHRRLSACPPPEG